MDAYQKVDRFNAANGTNARLISGRAARAVLSDRSCIARLFEFEGWPCLSGKVVSSTIIPPFLIDRLVAFGETGRPLGGSITYSSGSSQVILPTGKHRDSIDVCLYTAHLSARDFVVSGKRLTVDIDPKRLLASEHFPSGPGDLNPMDPTSGLPFGPDFLDVLFNGSILDVNNRVAYPFEYRDDRLMFHPDFIRRTPTVALARKQDKPYIGNICRGIVCVGLAGAFNTSHLLMYHGPEEERLALLVELSDEDLKRLHITNRVGHEFAGFEQFSSTKVITRFEADHLTPGWFDPDGEGRMKFLQKLGLQQQSFDS